MKFLKRARKSMDFSVVIILMSALLFVWTSTSAKEPNDIEQYLEKSWEVTEGESLWLIAKSQSNVSDLSIEEIVQWMVQKNELDSERIFPGQQLIVPIKLEAYVKE